ncbi:MAG: flap endonuclease-1 [Candidatus Aenigmatarchaeota archaeon]
MGVQLGDIIKANEIGLEQLSGKRIAIDAFNWIYQFLTIIRQKDGKPLEDSKGRVTSHLSGLFYRNMRLLETGIKPIYVFDGEPPVLKKETTEKRRDIRLEALHAWKEALQKEDFEGARKYAQRSATITDEIIDDSKQLLDAMGIPNIQAPSEGEALCTLITMKGDAYAAATQDYDALLFGCPRVVRNLSISGRRKRAGGYVTINPEIIILNDALRELDINQSQLILIGILAGTDYNPGGVTGYGPKKALELVKEKTLNAVKKSVIWDFDISMEEIYEFFRKPLKCSYDIKFHEPYPEKVKQILCDEHEFSEERIENALKKLDESRGEQKSLDKWG